MIVGAKQGRGKGFTLVEILIALAIFTTVVAAIYSAWTAILRSTRVAQEAAVDAQRMRISLQVLEDSIMSIGAFQDGLNHHWFLADTSGDFPLLSFVARLPHSSPRSGVFLEKTVRRLTFTVEQTTNSSASLVLRQTPVLFEPLKNEEENPLVLLRDLGLFTLEFWGDQSTEWETQWLYTNQIPRFIRFSLGVRAAGNGPVKPEDVITRVVWIPVGLLPAAARAAGGRGPGAGGAGGTPAPGRGQGGGAGSPGQNPGRGADGPPARNQPPRQ